MRVNPRREGESKGDNKQNKQYRGNFFFPLFPSCASLDLGREFSSSPSSSCPAPPEGECKDVPKATAVTGGEGAAWLAKGMCSLSPRARLGAGALNSDG